jgi:hypothetical protein
MEQKSWQWLNKYYLRMARTCCNCIIILELHICCDLKQNKRKMCTCLPCWQESPIGSLHLIVLRCFITVLPATPVFQTVSFLDICYQNLVCISHSTCPAHVIFNFIILISGKYKMWSFSLSSFLNLYVIYNKSIYSLYHHKVSILNSHFIKYNIVTRS